MPLSWSVSQLPCSCSGFKRSTSKASNQEALLFLRLFVLGLHQQHMEVPRLGVKSELQLPAYATAMATQDPSCIFDLCYSLQKCRILSPLREARDGTRILTDTMLGY